MGLDSKTILKEIDADAVLITDEYNIRYVSGFTGGEAVLYVSPSRRVLITDSRYTEAAGKESDFEVVEWNSSLRKEEILAECIHDDKAETLAYEDNSMLCSEFNTFCSRLTEIKRWLPVGNALNDLRRVKTPQELEYMRRAESIGDEAFASLLKVIRPGMTELEVVAELEYQMRKCGGQGTSFDTIAASGLNSSMPHAVPCEKKLEKGDFLTLDFGCKYNGYCSDMTRTIVIGKADEKQKEIYNIVLRANLEAEQMLRAGLRGCDVDKAARDIIAEKGYGKCFGHGLGHSVGLFIHESPRLSPNDSTVLLPGMIETVEPGIYVPGFGGVRIEDMVIVTQDGHENLSHSPKELIEI
ncbi:MAG: aminopeptidase P family protein [Clostridia bacterium]|nr:aminopeptidase P family protein [Clostridia bacterium]